MCVGRARLAGVELVRALPRFVVLAEDGQQPIFQDIVASGDGRALHLELVPHPSPQRAQSIHIYI